MYLKRTNLDFARYLETNGKLRERNPVSDNDSVTRKNMRSKNDLKMFFKVKIFDLGLIG